MKKYFDKNNGFTLIELLVVIAVIGVLASVVMLSLSTARTKSGDGGTRKQIMEARSQAEIFFLNNNNRYVNASNVSMCDPSITAYRVNPMLVKIAGTSRTTVSTALATAQAASNAGNLTTTLANGTVCHVAANGSAYAISTRLIGAAAQYLCVDSANKNRVTATPLAANATTCP